MKNLIRNIELNPTTADNHLRLIEEYRKNNGDSLAVEQLYEGALSECGLHPSEGPIIWSGYRSYLNKLDELCSETRVKRIRYLFYRQMSLPLSGLPDLFDEYRLWEEELFEKSTESLNMAEEHFIKGQQEWNLRKPYEMRIHTDNVSNIQELFDAWMLYINFEKDKMISIEYSSNIDHDMNSDSYSSTCVCNKEGSLTEYKYDPKDSVIMAYRRALDDLGSLRIDLWFEFANFISTTYNCPHLLLNVYYSSLKHFEKNPKLWILYLRTIVEAAKDRISHYNSLGHHYTPSCKIRSSSVWYPLNEEILCLSDETEIKEFYMNKILTEFSIIKELFKSMKNEMIEMYTIIADSIFDLVKFKSFGPNEGNSLSEKNMDRDFIGNVGNNEVIKDHKHNLEYSDKYKLFKEKAFEVLKNIYIEGDGVIIEIFKESEQIIEGENFFLMEESVLMFYSQWMNFESMNPDGISTLISIIEKIIDNFESKLKMLLPLIFSVAKEKFGDCNDFRKKIEDLISKKPEGIHSKVVDEWDKAVAISTLIENFEKRKSKLPNSNALSPIINHISSGTSISKKNDTYQDQIFSSTSLVNKLQYFNGNQKIQILSESGRSRDSNEGDFVCLSEIRFRRDKRRFRRNLFESDYDSSSECSSESNSIKSAFIQNSSNIVNKMARNFTPPSTPNNISLQKMVSNASVNNFPQNLFLVSPCSPGYNTNNYNNVNGLQHNTMQTNEIMDTSTTGGGLSFHQRSPFGGGSLCDLELRTQCTWDGREAIEPSIAPPIPPIPALSSISSSSSHSSYRKRNSRFSVQPISLLEANSTERSCDESSMPPPSYTPKKGRIERKSESNCLFQSSEDSDINIIQESIDRSKKEETYLDKNVVSSNLDTEIKGTLFLRFPLDLEISEDLVLTNYFEKYSKSIKEIRIVKNSSGENRGFAYIDLKSERIASDIINDSNFIKLLSNYKILVSLSDDPKQFCVNENVLKDANSEKNRYRFRRRKKRQIEKKKNSCDSTILVKNIDKSLDEKSIVDHFQNCLDLKVKNISLSKDEKGNSRGFAFIEFLNSDDALTAHMLNESKLGKNSITINSSTRPLTIPRSNQVREKGDFINARFIPRTKSRQKLPPNRRNNSNSDQISTEKGVETDSKSHSLTNEDFRKMFSLG
ncbi:RNA-binding protein [Cryptosporidium xiaoi]|uniref:RNA-binding protein n=1 Tax=Cryptosporidium xiaoi TaxID=659607 RepID=A0AAV9XZ36_9CRYT